MVGSQGSEARIFVSFKNMMHRMEMSWILFIIVEIYPTIMIPIIKIKFEHY